MKKTSLYISMLLCFICTLPLLSHAQFNIVKNHSFEQSTSNYSNAIYDNKVTNWAKGYSSPSNHSSYPYNYGGTPDYFYYSGTSNCGFGTPPNIWVDPSYYPTYPVTGQKFVLLAGNTNSYGESVIGEFEAPLCEQTYTVSLWARATNSQLTSLGSCTAWNNLTTFANNKIEVVLRKTNNYTLEKVIYTTPTLDYTQWVHYTQPVTITAADIAAGYDRIEFRHVYMGPTAIPTNESAHAFIDEVGLIAPISTSTTNISVNCGDTIDLDTTRPACNDSTSWTLLNQTVVNPTTVSPSANTTYIKKCFTASGCLESIDTVNVEVKTGTYNNITRSIACGDSIDLDTLSNTSCHTTEWYLVGQGLIGSTIISSSTAQQYVKICYTAEGCIKAIDTITIDIDTTSIIQIAEQTVLCGNCIDLAQFICSSPLTTEWPAGVTYNTTTGEALYCPTNEAEIEIKCLNDNGECPPIIKRIPINIDTPYIGIDWYDVYWLCNQQSFIPTNINCQIPPNAIYEWTNWEYSQGIGPISHIISSGNNIELLYQDYAVYEPIDPITFYHDNSFTLTIYDENGCPICKYSYRIYWTENTPEVRDFIPDVYYICPGGCVNVSVPGSLSNVYIANIASVNWNPSTLVLDLGGGNYQICPTGPLPQDYVITYTNDQGCEVAKTTFKFVQGECKKGGTTSISGVSELVSSVNIYPNPSTGVFTLELTNYDLPNTTYTVVDAVGREIMKTDNITSAKTAIDLSKYDKGIYFIRIQEGEAITTKKIIIQ